MRRKLIPILAFLLIISTLGPLQPVMASSTQDEVVKIAKEYIGVPYKFGGTTPSGFDCSGFIKYVMDKADVKMPRTASEQYNSGEAVKKANLQKGDLVFFETYKPGPSHSGIYVGDGKFIHASSSKGITISSVNDPYYWGPRYLGAKRVIKEEKTEAAVAKVEEQPKRILGEGEFHDVATNHWAFNEIKKLSVQSIISGYGNHKFGPNDKLTRAQIAALLSRAVGLDTSSRVHGFSDVSDEHWGVGAIAAADRAGYFSYLAGDAFNPNEPVTRDEIAVLFAKAFDLTVSESDDLLFSDVDSSNWAHKEISALQSSGIVKGFEDGTYRPSNQVTRAEFSKILYNALY
ncbi:C40 family peptidase [Halalkalibacter urbisdiaboli]|uniref:C40 family peptidase n=1 Tax=Halalkalibacter urbisdiaboli TaxID=1960589 RepID=UPI0013FE0178|nr:C40 family peptidase [Halalkalibacter urbisdiaboli]